MLNYIFSIKFMRLCFLYVVVIFSAEGCISGGVDEPVPEGAYDVERVYSETYSAHQMSFKVNEKYPGTSAMDFYIKRFIDKSDWSICDVNNDWVVMHRGAIDSNSAEPFYQMMRYFANQKEKELVMVMLRHEADNSNSDAFSINENIQYVVVVKYDLDKQSYLKTLSFLDIKKY